MRSVLSTSALAPAAGADMLDSGVNMFCATEFL